VWVAQITLSIRLCVWYSLNRNGHMKTHPSVVAFQQNVLLFYASSSHKNKKKVLKSVQISQVEFQLKRISMNSGFTERWLPHHLEKEKGKEAYLYSTILYTMYISKRSGMDHTVLPANTQCLLFVCKRSPDGATPNWCRRHPIAAYCSSIDPKGMKGWVGLADWPIADGLPT